MRIRVNDQIHTREGSATVRDILKDLGLDPLSTVVVCNGTPVTEDQKLGDEDTIQIINAISGG
jgi:thiamine biosynthesis protein ThiS